MRSFFKAEKQKEEHNMSTREKLNKKIARQIREEIAEAIMPRQKESPSSEDAVHKNSRREISSLLPENNSS